MAAFQENSLRVNVEFLRSSQARVGRVIRFNHTPEIVPPQLQGRLHPDEWRAFMADLDTLAKHHPYVQTPGAKDYGKWAACFAIGAVVGLFCVNGDAGDYGQWQSEAQGVVQRHQAMFQQAGCALSLQRGREFWMQIDVDPNKAPAVPVAAGAPPPVAGGNFISPFQSMKKINLDVPESLEEEAAPNAKEPSSNK